MKLCKVSDLKGGEVLAKAILTPELRILLSEETKLRPDYIEKIKELGISEVYIKEEEHVHAEEVVLLKTNVEIFFRDRVKSILEKHTYNKNSELSAVNVAREQILIECSYISELLSLIS